MYVIRATFRVKFGCLQEHLALWKESREKSGAHVYLPVTGPLDVYAQESEYETMAAMEQGTAELSLRNTTSC